MSGFDTGTGRERIEVEVGSTAETTPSFGELYDREFAPLVRLATLMTGRPEVARDVVQDAFVKLHVKWSGVRSPGAYARRSVVNGCKSHVRDEYRRRKRDSKLAAGDAQLDVDHTLATLSVLSHKERAMVVLKFYEQRSEGEISEVVGCRPGSVGPTIQRALAKLRPLQ